MRHALTQLLPEDRRSIEKRSCKRRDSNERPNYQNVSLLLSSAASFFDWSQSHCLSLLQLVFPFLTSFYGNRGTKFSKKRLNGDLASPQAAQLEGAIRERPTTSLLHSPEENGGIGVRTDWPSPSSAGKGARRWPRLLSQYRFSPSTFLALDRLRRYVFLMSLAEIEKAVDELSQEELTKLAAYITRRNKLAWDQEIEEDFSSGGKHEKTLEKIDAEIDSGNFTPLP